MSSSGERFWCFEIKCNSLGCKASRSRMGYSEQEAFTLLQHEAKLSGWLVSPDRLYSDVDWCPEHRPKVQP